MKKFILFLSLIAILMSNNLMAQDSRNDIDPNAPKVQGTGNSTEAMYDLLAYYNVDSLTTATGGYGVVWTGNYYIVSIFNLNAFYKVSANWSLIAGPIAIAGSTLPAANGFRDMEFAKGYLWGVAANSASNRIYKVDTATFTQQSVINLPAGVIPRDLAWDPVRNGFWTSTNNFAGNLQCYDTNGVAIAGATIPTVVGGFYGIAYDGSSAGGPYLWLAKDPSPAGPSITAIVKFNISAAPVRLDSAVITIPGTVGAPNLASGGLDFRTNLIPGKSTLIGVVQGTPDKVVVYDVTPTPLVCNYYWSTQTSGTGVLLYSVSAVSTQVGWTAGAGAVVRRTTDGGTSWGNGNPNPGVISGDIYNIWAWSANDAICTTSPSATNIYKTSNGGVNWVQVFTQVGGFIDALQMVSATEGYGVGDPVDGKWTIVKTTDGGNTWARMATEPTQVGSEAGYNNSLDIVGTNIWFGTNTTKVYRSTDMGLTWTSGATTGTASSFSVHFNSATNGMTGGSALVKSTDGGVTYTSTTIPGPSGSISGIDGKGIDWWVTRTGTSVYKSTNQGGTWTTEYTVTGAAFNHISLTDGVGGCPTGWAVGTGTIVKMTGTTTGVSSYSGEIPSSYLLKQNYPNPFNPTTNINFSIPKSGFVTLKVYNTVGMEVATLLNENKTAGNYLVGFNAANLPSGAYFYRLEADNYVETKKMLLLK